MISLAIVAFTLAAVVLLFLLRGYQLKRWPHHVPFLNDDEE